MDRPAYVDIAENIARTAHAGQQDLTGAPYIDHPARVAATFKEHPEAEATAWLHDVIEDTEVTLADLAAQNIPERVIEAVDILTKKSGYDTDEYLAAVKAHPIAALVKRADIRHNMAPSRLKHLDARTQARLMGKYAKYLAVLADGELTQSPDEAC